MSKATTTPTARERLDKLHAERERILADLGEARDRVKALRALRVEALGGEPDVRAARALDADLTAARHDVDTLEELLEDIAPGYQALQRVVLDEERAVSRRETLERELAVIAAEAEIVGHMDAVRAIADRFGNAYGTPFRRSPAALVRLARGRTWTTALREELATNANRATAELEALKAAGQ